MALLKSIVSIPVYLISAWLLLAGGWQTFEMYRWANNKAEGIEQAAEKVDRAASLANLVGGAGDAR